MRYFLLLFFLFVVTLVWGGAVIRGIVTDAEGKPLPFANIVLKNTAYGAVSDSVGQFQLEVNESGEYQLLVSYVGYLTHSESLELNSISSINLSIGMISSPELDEVVVTGTMREMSRTDSPVPVEVYSPAFFKKNPSPSIYEAMHNVNGLRPQLNCNVCNTGDIHINGLEGPYTMVMIDGMPVVSGLSTVYGLMGIPNSMVERIEVVKGPASTLYGSEAIGGLINVITKSPEDHEKVSFEIMTTSWLESQVDIGVRTSISEKVDVLTGIHMFNYQLPIDNNGDNFTDKTLSKRVSIFQKWSFKRKQNRLFTLGSRYYHEDRWGGEMHWTPEYRGGDSIYGESIYTRRLEMFSKYQLPVNERIFLWMSYNGHHQNSFYGDLPFQAKQHIAFAQFTYDKKLGINDFTFGLGSRYSFYDDNTVATEYKSNSVIHNNPDIIWYPGLFIQDDLKLSQKSRLLLGLRYDYHQRHGGILTPRLAYKLKINHNNSIRLNAGSGFRVVNIFTEDHAALTGARDIVFEEDLEAEKSYNLNLNFLKRIYSDNGSYYGIDLSLFHSRFSNKIIPDYDTDPNLIIYENLDGYAISQGITFNVEAVFNRYLKAMAGMTFTDVYSMERGSEGKYERIQPILTESWSAKWSLTFTMPRIRTWIDYTGSLYSPMRLPLLSDTDPRSEYSPWWSLQNLQITNESKNGKWEVFAGIKNLLNFLPPLNSIARPHDPFDKKVVHDSEGNVQVSEENPYALTFDPSYSYAPNQGLRFFAGLRLSL